MLTTKLIGDRENSAAGVRCASPCFGGEARRADPTLHAVPRRVGGAFAIFSDALASLSLCGDVAQAAGSTAARTYALGASGALRHAMAILRHEGLMDGVDEPAGFSTMKIGRSELVGTEAGWDTALRCRLFDGGEVRACAFRPVVRPEDGVWSRMDPSLSNLWCRGRLEATDEGLIFHDEPDREHVPVPPISADLGRDLMALGEGRLDLAPTLAMALEISLVAGSWYHLETGRRWFADRATARAIVRSMGCSVPVDDETARRFAGCIDREALLLIERAGWRHVPTPAAVDSGN